MICYCLGLNVHEKHYMYDVVGVSTWYMYMFYGRYVMGM